VLLILEIFTGTFYLLMIAIGCGAGGLAAWFGVPMAPQLVIAAAISLIATLILRRSKLGKSNNVDSARDRNVNLDIGESVMVPSWNAGGVARVMYRGAMWDVELAPGQSADPGVYSINEIRGSRLIVGRSPAAV
jgi:membrane protein implicated in regulation of membrane protease activity